MADEFDPADVQTPNDLIAFLRRLQEDIEREAAEMKRREAAGDRLAVLSSDYASFTFPDALESLAGWLEGRFTNEQYLERPGASDSTDAEKWREVARCMLMAAIYE